MELKLGRRHRLRVIGLTVGYNHAPVIRDVSFEAITPTLVQILGPNGAGKTTLLKALLGLLKPISGHVYIDDVDVTGNPGKAGKYIGYVPQFFVSATTHYPITPWELLENTLLLYRKRWPRLFVGIEYKRRIAELLRAVGLSREAWFKTFWQLSGGQRQRVLIAKALIHDPPILIMDEPFSAVDPAGKVDLANLIGCLKQTKIIIVTSHDPMLLLPYTDYVMLLNREKYVYGKPNQVLREDVATRFYGQAVIPVKEHIHICDFHA